MKVGDLIRMITDRHPSEWILPEDHGLLIRIGKRHNGRRVGTVLTHRGIETWPLDSHYEYEVISESR